MSKIERPADVVGGPRHTHQAESSPATGVRQTRGYCNQSSLGTHGKEILFPKDQTSQPPTPTGNSRRIKKKGVDFRVEHSVLSPAAREALSVAPALSHFPSLHRVSMLA